MVDRLVEVLDERDQDRGRLTREHEGLDGCDLAAQPLDRIDPFPVRRCRMLHAREYAARPGPKAIVKQLWSGGHVMVAPG